MKVAFLITFGGPLEIVSDLSSTCCGVTLSKLALLWAVCWTKWNAVDPSNPSYSTSLCFTLLLASLRSDADSSLPPMFIQRSKWRRLYLHYRIIETLIGSDLWKSCNPTSLGPSPALDQVSRDFVQLSLQEWRSHNLICSATWLLEEGLPKVTKDALFLTSNMNKVHCWELSLT